MRLPPAMCVCGLNCSRPVWIFVVCKWLVAVVAVAMQELWEDGRRRGTQDGSVCRSFLLYDTYTISHLCFCNVPFVLLHTCANKLMEWLHDSRSIGLAIWRSLFSVRLTATIWHAYLHTVWLGSRVVSVLDSGTVGPAFKLKLRCCWVTVLGKLFTPIVPLFT